METKCPATDRFRDKKNADMETKCPATDRFRDKKNADMETKCPEAKSYGDQISKNQNANINKILLYHFGECIYHKRELK